MKKKKGKKVRLIFHIDSYLGPAGSLYFILHQVYIYLL
jgi:hypothetical protein